MAQPFRTVGSASTSPSNHSLTGSTSHTITLSSLVGDYIYLTIQITRDFQPIVYRNRRLPVEGFDLGVCDATFAQLQAISPDIRSRVDAARSNNFSLSQWQALLSESMLSLPDVMKVAIPEYKLRHVPEAEKPFISRFFHLHLGCALTLRSQPSLVRSRRPPIIAPASI